MPDPVIAFIFAVFVLAGFVKGAIGLGLPSVSMGLMAVVMSPGQAAALVVVPSLVTNFWQMVAGPYFPAAVCDGWADCWSRPASAPGSAPAG